MGAALSIAVEESKKWGRDDSSVPEKLVVIMMGLIPLVRGDADIVITYNAPVSKVEELKFLEEAAQNGQADLSKWPEHLQTARQRIVDAMKSFNVQDWSLFG